MLERLHVSAIVLIAAVVWCLLLLLQGVDVSVDWLRHFSMVIGILLLFLGAFDLFLWRLPFLQGWFVKRPNIRGTWKVTIEFKLTKGDMEEARPALTGFMSVRQTYSFISLRLMTKESRSEMLGAQILRSEDGTYKVTGVYRNQPKVGVRHRSPIHHGAVLLQVAGALPYELEGHYWTDRNTAGDIALSDRNKKVVDSYEAAISLFAT